MKENFLTIDTSIIYRSTQKYFDNALAKFNIGYGQVLFLTLIYENEGITMNQLSSLGSFDKGTITKSIQKLIDLDYIRYEVSTEDKRHKFLYTTNKCQEVIHQIYLLKHEWYVNLLSNFTEDEINMYIKLSDKITDKAREYQKELTENSEIKLFGIEKLSLIDYPKLLSSVIFTGGCNFRCPFCHNRQLVFLNENINEINLKTIFDFLNKRQGLIDGVCISGGEPLLHNGLENFICKIRSLGYKVKLDTNGSYPDKLKHLIDEGLIDYIAMDIKNSKAKYTKTIDIDAFDINLIDKSIHIIMESNVDYEFRTTFVKEFHTLEDVKEIGEWIKGAKRYNIQSFKNGPNVIRNNLHSLSYAELVAFKNCMEDYVDEVNLIGVE